MASPRTLVVVLNYQGEVVLLPCLRSLAPQLDPGDAFLVIDQGDEAALMHTAQAMFPSLQIIVPPENGGFAKGMNIGLRLAREQGFDAVWIVNNDTLAGEKALTSLKAALRDRPGINLFSPLITTPEGAVWFAGGWIDYGRMRTRHNQAIPRSLAPFETRFLTGCALFIPTTVLERVGYLDERFFLYYEDADYSERVRSHQGKLWVVPQARLVHSEASTVNPQKTYWLVRSGTLFFLQHAHGMQRSWVRCFLWLRRLKNRVQCCMRKDPVAESVKQAYTDALNTLHD